MDNTLLFVNSLTEGTNIYKPIQINKTIILRTIRLRIIFKIRFNVFINHLKTKPIAHKGHGLKFYSDSIFTRRGADIGLTISKTKCIVEYFLSSTPMSIPGSAMNSQRRV